MAPRSIKVAKTARPVDCLLTAEQMARACTAIEEEIVAKIAAAAEEIAAKVAAADRAWEVRLGQVEARILDVKRECERLKAERDALALTLALRFLQGGLPS